MSVKEARRVARSVIEKPSKNADEMYEAASHIGHNNNYKSHEPRNNMNQ